MSKTPTFYRDKAAECARLAQTSTFDSQRAAYEEMANAWNLVALRVDRMEKCVDDTEDRPH
jgi:hypothetical protein